MATDKRARKKEHRDAMRAAYEAKLRRRRAARVIGVVAVLLVLVGLAIFSRGGDQDDAAPTAKETPGAEPACGAEAPPEGDPQQYDAPPENQLEDGVDYQARITTSCGVIEMDLFEEEAPETVNNFVFLAREGFYDGQIWHRVQQNFVIQAGDPNRQAGVAPDDPGYSIPDELPEKGDAYTYGTLAMANSGAPNSGGSQFFIVVHKGPNEDLEEPAGLTPTYSIFGEVDPSSYETVDKIAKQPIKLDDPNPAEAQEPVNPVYIETIEIIER